MANLLILKNRIRSVKNIAQITKAMELVAATKMKKSQQRAIDARHYSEELQNLVSKMSSNNVKVQNFEPLQQDNVSTKKLLIIVGPSKGLAGGLVSNLAREVYNFLSKNPDTDIISIDKKGAYIAEHSGKNIIAALATIKTNIEEFDLEGIFEIVKTSFLEKKYSEVYITHTHFINTLVQKPKTEKILPINASAFGTSSYKEERIPPSLEEGKQRGVEDILIEPDKTTVLNFLLNKYIDNKIFISVLDSISSEYSARMIAMKNANDNATDIKDDLTLEYNQSRQAAITGQILEIAGATAAMEANE